MAVHLLLQGRRSMPLLYHRQQGTRCSAAPPLKAYTKSWPGSSARRMTAWKLSALPASSGRDALSSAARQNTCHHRMLCRWPCRPPGCVSRTALHRTEELLETVVLMTVTGSVTIHYTMRLGESVAGTGGAVFHRREGLETAVRAAASGRLAPHRAGASQGEALRPLTGEGVLHN